MMSRKDAPPNVESVDPENFLIVGIGASAGGLEALEQFFRAVPHDASMAFVVVQHLSPDHKSLMDKLLRRCTGIPITYAENRMPVRPNQIYLLPPRKEIAIQDGCLMLSEKSRDGELSLPIDHFFRSLAKEAASHAVGVILSGTGSDGSRGLQEIHNAGGLALCQTQETAKFDGMPRAAENTGIVDLVLAPGEMPEALQRYADYPLTTNVSEVAPVVFSAQGAMNSIFQLLKSKYELDFSQYKATTICRRIERRLLMGPTSDLEDYVEHLESDPGELDLLYKDLLIGVTRFFRDSEAYEKLEQNLINELVGKCDSEEDFRVWIAGCATGEEAYSLAILLYEEFERQKRPVNLKIFATDVHEGSLAVAGRGIYAEESLGEISADRLGRFFKKVPNGYQVSPQLRKMIVFAPHNVIADPPFTNLHLVSCRNLLIYLKTAAQKKAISLFHFCLQVGGCLWLGPSETLGDLAEEFDVVDERWRIYRKARDVRLASSLGSSSGSLETLRRTAVRSRQPGTTNQLMELYDRLLSDYMPAGFLVNENRQLIHTFAGAGRYLKQKDGRPSLDVLDLLTPELKVPFAAALQRAKKERSPAVYTGIRCRDADEETEVKLTVKPYYDSMDNSTQLLVLLEPMQPRLEDETPQSVDAVQLSADQVHALESELRFTKETLQSTIEQLETTNEELQASNEELVASNEELQSTNEELHSVNEELYTVNAEHQRKITELTELTDDMQNLLNSTDVQILFLDRELRIRKFTPGMARTFSLIPQDIGRPVDNLTHSIDVEDLLGRLKQVLYSEELFEQYVQDRKANWYLLRILPYLSQQEIEGVVLTLFDVTELKDAESRLAALSAIVEQSEEAIIRCDKAGIACTWNGGAERLFGYTAEEFIGRNVADLEPAERTGETLQLKENALAQGRTVDHVETTRRRKDGEEIHISLSISPLHDPEGQLVGVSLLAHDITERKQAEHSIRDAVERRDQFLAMLSHELRNPLGAVLNATYVLEQVNGTTRDDRLKQACDVILRQGQQMTRLLDDLLDVSRVTQGKIELRKEIFDLRTIAEEALEVIQTQLVDRELELQMEAPESALWVDADRSRLLQVLQNLLKNSVKYSPAGEQILFQLEQEETEGVLRVRDTGIGIPPDQLDTIFDLFVQSEDSLDRSEGGMGVGLTLVKAVVELHDGTVTAHSEGRGRGSEFIVRLPLSSQGRLPGANSPAAPAARVSRVVIVEDLADSREMLETLLTLEGCHVVTAASGMAGLTAIRETHPELALVDIGLPEMDGYEVARRLRSDPANDDIFLVALTGYGQPQDREAVLAAGFNDHLIKPLQPEALYRVLARTVEEETSDQ